MIVGFSAENFWTFFKYFFGLRQPYKKWVFSEKLFSLSYFSVNESFSDFLASSFAVQSVLHSTFSAESFEEICMSWINHKYSILSQTYWKNSRLSAKNFQHRCQNCFYLFIGTDWGKTKFWKKNRLLYQFRTLTKKVSDL